MIANLVSPAAYPQADHNQRQNNSVDALVHPIVSNLLQFKSMQQPEQTCVCGELLS